MQNIGNEYVSRFYLCEIKLDNMLDFIDPPPKHTHTLQKGVKFSPKGQFSLLSVEKKNTYFHICEWNKMV